MPAPDPTLWTAARRILDLLDDLPPEADRDAHAREACLRDDGTLNDALYTEVCESLAAEDASDASGFLATDAAQAAAHLLAAGGVEAVGRRVGPWEIGGLLGEGGMGAVYRAHRADGAYAQEVALKVIGRGLAPPSLLDRFRRERQILAGLSHPNVARLLDGAALAPAFATPVQTETLAETLAVAIGRHLPENAIVCDEAVTTGRDFFRFTAGSAAHDWLQVTGGAIGGGMPLATGAAIACPGRKVVNLQADGSAMYTNQALWTMAREKLDICVVIFANRKYQILLGELKGVGAGEPGLNASRMLNLDDPSIDFVKLAESMGVEAARADTAEGFADLFARAMKTEGPFLIEAVI